MTDERFSELLNGPLSHPMPMFTITRLALALRAVVEATGYLGEITLVKHCAQREAQDRRNSADGPGDSSVFDRGDIKTFVEGTKSE